MARTVPCVEGVGTADFAAYIARIGKVKDNPEKLMKYLLDHKHFSPFEHTYFTFKIDTSLNIGRQLLRHRSFTFQELSGRYEEMLEMEPVELRRQAEKNRQSSEEVINPILYESDPSSLAEEEVQAVLLFIDKTYKALLKAGVARECARGILPGCTATTILMTGNIRSWIHFLEIRDDGHAQKEIQAIAKEIRVALAKEVPGLFGEVQNN